MRRSVTLLLTILVFVASGFAQVTKTTVFGDIAYYGDVDSTGAAVLIAGTREVPAQLSFKHKNRVAVRILSQRFTLNDNSIVASQTSARVYLYDTVNNTIDSVYHNNLGFRYDNEKKRLLLYRKDNGVGVGPFHDTYHGFDLFLEALYWEKGSNEMVFRRLVGPGGSSEGVVSSTRFFRNYEYQMLRGIDKMHPMEIISKFLKIYGDDHNRFHINDYVSYVKYPYHQVLTMMTSLQSRGYVEYDQETKMVTVLDRFFDVLASAHESFDYDVIKFQTSVGQQQPNIRLMLTSNDMLVYGITDMQAETNTPSITLSDFKHVVIIPDNARVVLKKNRDFNFSGCIMAGMYEFFTKDCLFNYNRFTIEMNKVDSLRFYARFGNKVYPVEGVLERLSGTLNIDESDNKSSLRETPEYPKFHSEGKGYKFFRDINGGAFDLELPPDSLLQDSLEGKFYFCLEPFSVDSLDNLKSEDVAFKGKLVSGGILPDIEQPLVVMEDHSLGFRHEVGAGSGYPLYGGLGYFDQEIHLSNEGFYGEGRMTVESSQFVSERFNFYPDSVTAAVQSLSMAERSAGTHFPKGSCGPLDLKWDVTVPRLYTITKDEPICLYDSTFFTGRTMLSNDGLHGDGVLTFGRTRFDSKYFDFDTRSFVADSSGFTLFDNDGKAKAFLADNYRSSVNLSGKKARFEHLDSESNLDFPLNKFYCSLNEAEWDMSTNQIRLSSPTSSQAESKFVSLLPEHDSLSFNSTSADYDMDDYVIRAHEVKNLFVADAEIIPMNGTVEILRNAEISPLEHAVIVADTASRKHHFKDAAVSIYSRNDYSALGLKDYVSAQGVATPVFFEEIAPDRGVTVAHAHVDEDMDLMLSPYFGFKGVITSKATEPYDFYEGDFKLVQSCHEDTVWLASATNINPKAVEIPVTMMDVRERLLEPMEAQTVPMKMKKGDLLYDQAKRRFLIRNKDYSSQYIELSDRCVTTTHAATDLGFNLGLAQFACYGDYVSYPNDSMTMNILCVFNAPVFDEPILKEIAEVYAAVEGEAVDLTKTDYVEYLRSEKGVEEAEKLRQSIELTGYPEIGADDFYDNTIVIPSLKMVWNPDLRAFVSEGKIGLGSLGKNVVNRYVDGYVMFDKRLGVITFFFLNDLFMTYLSYNCGDGQLQVHATYGTVNAHLSDMKAKKRSVRSGIMSFEYVVTPYEAITHFLSRLKRAGVR